MIGYSVTLPFIQHSLSPLHYLNFPHLFIFIFLPCPILPCPTFPYTVVSSPTLLHSIFLFTFLPSHHSSFLSFPFILLHCLPHLIFTTSPLPHPPTPPYPTLPPTLPYPTLPYLSLPPSTHLFSHPHILRQVKK